MILTHRNVKYFADSIDVVIFLMIIYIFYNLIKMSSKTKVYLYKRYQTMWENIKLIFTVERCISNR